jgi:hypothetical protein
MLIVRSSTTRASGGSHEPGVPPVPDVKLGPPVWIPPDPSGTIAPALSVPVHAATAAASVHAASEANEHRVNLTSEQTIWS